MPTEVTIRHTDVAEGMKQHATTKAEEIMKEFPIAENVHVILDRQKFLYRAEFVVQGKHHLRLESSAEAEEVSAAADMAFDKMNAQLRKAVKKVQDRRDQGA